MNLSNLQGLKVHELKDIINEAQRQLDILNSGPLDLHIGYRDTSSEDTGDFEYYNMSDAAAVSTLNTLIEMWFHKVKEVGLSQLYEQEIDRYQPSLSVRLPLLSLSAIYKQREEKE